MIFGQGLDVTLGASLRVTVIATGFSEKEIGSELKKRTVYDLDSAKEIPQEKEVVKQPEPTRFTFAPQSPMSAAPQKEMPKADENKVVYSFDFNQPEKPQEAPKVKKDYSDTPLFQLSDKYEIREVEEEHENTQEELDKAEAEYKRQLLIKQSEERIKRLKELSSDQSADLKTFKEKLEVPAYLRRNIRLNDAPHSSEDNISRYNLNDDNDILGNNKFLHDNVD